VDVDAYLALLGFKSPIEPDLANLERLQQAHLTTVPFENLDVYARRGVRTDDLWSVSKVVERRRGGWCFELNGSFAALLTDLGYDVTRHAATVLFSQTTIPSHLTLKVELDRPYLVDVGFGDSFIRPLPLDSEGPHDGGSGMFGFRFEDDLITLVALSDDGKTEPQYRFDRTPRRPADFDEASLMLQTQPGLQWTKTRFATRLIDGGPDRVTLLEGRIRHRRAGTWTETKVDDAEWESVLGDWFGLTP
jgi:N-hydroxyarylamine O-acetyltransferase